MASSAAAPARAMAVLYRCTTPTDWLCPCGRVARALRRADIPFSEERVPQRRDRRPEVEALSGQRRVPLLVLDGEIVCDSRRILEHLEWKCPPSDASRASSRRSPPPRSSVPEPPSPPPGR